MLSHEKARRDSETRISQKIEQEDLRKQKWVDSKVSTKNFDNTHQNSPNYDSGVELRFKSPMSNTNTSVYKFTKEQEEKRRTLAQDLQNKYFGQEDIL